MFDRFKKLLGSAEADLDDSTAETAPPNPVKRASSGSGPDKVTLSGASSLAIPDSLKTGDPGMTEGAAPRAAVPMTFGLREMMRAKPMQHFLILADAIQPNGQYRFHDVGGRYFEVYKKDFPALDRFTSLVFWGFNFQGDHKAQIRIIDMEDTVIAELSDAYQFRLERPSDTHETRTSWQVIFPAPGTYHVVVETDGRPTAVAPIFVMREA